MAVIGTWNLERRPPAVAVVHLKSKRLSYPGGRRAAEAAAVRVLADGLLSGEGDGEGEGDSEGDGRTRDVAVLGDLNDEPAATTRILLGPPGSEIGAPAFDHPGGGDAARLWNLALRIPDDQRCSRFHRGRHELIDYILVSHALLARGGAVFTGAATPPPSVADDPAAASGTVRASEPSGGPRPAELLIGSPCT